MLNTDYKEFWKDSIRENTTKDSIFGVDDENIYMRYDQIHIKQTEHSRVEVDYYWRGEKIHSLLVEQIDFSTGQWLVLRGSEGRIIVDVTQE